MTADPPFPLSDPAVDCPDAVHHACRLALDAALPMCVVWGREPRVVFNEAFGAALGGADGAGAAGLPLAQVFGVHAVQLRALLGQVGGKGAARGDIALPGACMALAVSPVRDAGGTVVGALCVGQPHARAHDGGAEAIGFILDISARLGHELRNPLGPVRTAASLLPLVRHDPARIAHIGRVILRQTARMTGLIDDLLDVSRVTRGTIALEREDLALRLLVDEAAEQVRPLMEARSHRLAILNEAADAVVHGDRKRLVQVLSNVLSNAARYTPPGGMIRLAVQARGDTVALTVRDHGIGMSAELAATAFELFRQGKRAPDCPQGGLGIGLALVRSLVLLHGGQVSVHSAGEGQGSEVAMRFPLRRSSQVAPAQQAAAAPPSGGACT